MSERDRFNKFVERYPHPHITFFNRPHFTRRRFFEVLGAGVTGSYLVGKMAKAEETTQAGVTMQNTAKNCIFILLAGAISHTDTFDLKVVNGVTPSNFNPTMVNGLNWPMGLLPKIGAQLGDLIANHGPTSRNSLKTARDRRRTSSTAELNRKNRPADLSPLVLHALRHPNPLHSVER